MTIYTVHIRMMRLYYGKPQEQIFYLGFFTNFSVRKYVNNKFWLSHKQRFFDSGLNFTLHRHKPLQYFHLSTQFELTYELKLELLD